MAGSPGSKYYDKFLKYTVSMQNADGDIVLDDENFRLLSLLKQTQSISRAAKELPISYRKAWGKLKTLEEKMGFPIIIKSRGGEKGGKTQLTEDGLRLINAYEDLYDNFNRQVKELTKEFFKKINR